MEALQQKLCNPNSMHKTSGVHRSANLRLRLETIHDSAPDNGIGLQFKCRVMDIEMCNYVPFKPQICGVPENIVEKFISGRLEHLRFLRFSIEVN